MYAWVSKYLLGLKSVFIYILLLAEGIKQINTSPHVLHIPIPFHTSVCSVCTIIAFSLFSVLLRLLGDLRKKHTQAFYSQ